MTYDQLLELAKKVDHQVTPVATLIVPYFGNDTAWVLTELPIGFLTMFNGNRHFVPWSNVVGLFIPPGTDGLITETQE